MNVLVVGGDCIASLKRVLAELGLRHIEHWDGRKSGYQKRTIPRRATVVVLLVDYVNHRLAGHVAEQATTMNVPIVYSRHSSKEVLRKLYELECLGRLTFPRRARGPAQYLSLLDFAYAV